MIVTVKKEWLALLPYSGGFPKRGERSWRNLKTVTDSSSNSSSHTSHTPSDGSLAPFSSSLRTLLHTSLTMASIIAPGVPQKAKTGITFSMYEDDEIHPSDEYESRIDNLIERPGSAPLTKYSILPLAPGQTHIVHLATPNVMPAITYMLNATLNPNSPYIGKLNRARSNSAPNLRHRGDFPPPVQIDFYGDLKRAQRLYGPEARVLVGKYVT